MAEHGVGIGLPRPNAAPGIETSGIRALLMCGILASVLYAAMNALIPLGWPGYSHLSRVISELSAVDAPTRSRWIPLGIGYGILMTLFGWGVWSVAPGNRHLRVAGGLLLVYGTIGLAPWPPMHQREVLAMSGGTLTDTLHIVWSGATVLLMMLALGFGAAAFGKRFRWYTMATTVTLIVFGLLTGIEAPAMEANRPTPWIGLWERINIGVFLLWIVVLALALLQSPQRHVISDTSAGASKYQPGRSSV